MKFLKALAATACAFALTSAVQAATYTDSSANYELNHMLATGDNGGDGFGAWEVETHGSGIDGAWAGCGIWDPSANDFQGDWAGKTKAFGIIGKGDGYGANAYRPFRAPLAVGDSFSLEMGVNWDPNAGIDALKGFALLAKGGTLQVLTINHRSNPGAIAINGETDDILNIDEGTYPMKWTFTAKDATTLTVTMTPRDGSKTIYEKDWTVDTSALDGFRLQSSNQNPYEDEKAAEERGETAQMWADRRQTYFDNFQLEIAAPLPEIVTLSFSKAKWDVTSNNQDLDFALTRDPAVGTLDVTVSSSDPSFVGSKVVSFAEGESTCDFTLQATLTGPGNYAKLTASATGCDPATYEVKGPNYRVNNGSDLVSFFAGETADIWINWDGGSRDDSKLTLTATPEGVIDVPTGWTLPEEGDVYVQSSVTALAPGNASLVLAYDGVEMAHCDFSVLSPGLSLSGPATANTGSTKVYTLTGILKQGLRDCELSISPENAAVADTASPFDLQDFDAEHNCYKKDISLTFGDYVGDVTLSVTYLDVYSASCTITVSEPVDPSMFDGYVAYDDASLYDAGGLDFSATGAGQEGFQAWGVFKDSAQFGGAIVDGADGGFPAILTDGKAFAIYANGDSPDYAIYRPFVNDLQPGQKASIEFIVPEKPGSALYVQFARVWDSYPYSRFEFWANNDKMGVNVKINDDTEDREELSWSVNPRRIVASVQRAADGSSYELRLSGYNEGSEFVDDIYVHVVNADVGSWSEGIQGIAVGGYDLASNFIFNKLAIEQVEEPVKVRTIGIAGTWNMDATGDYDFTVGPSEAGDPIGTVALAVTPDDGRVVLSATSVDVPGDGAAPFAVTVTSLPGEGEEAVTYTITATPADEAIPPAEFNLTPIRPNLWLACGNWEHTTDEGSIWLSLNATPSYYGTYAITSEDDSVLSVPETSLSITVDGDHQEAWFDVKIEGVGSAKIFATLGDNSAEYRFTIIPGTDVEIPAPAIVKGKGLSWDASILDNGFVLRGTDTLGESPDKDSWTDLVEGTDYVVEDGQVVVLFSSAYNYIAILQK